MLLREIYDSRVNYKRSDVPSSFWLNERTFVDGKDKKKEYKDAMKEEGK